MHAARTEETGGVLEEPAKMTPQELTAAVRETTFTYEEAQDLINLLKEKQVRGHVHMTSAKIWVF